jgi:hypothetical protein
VRHSTASTDDAARIDSELIGHHPGPIARVRRAARYRMDNKLAQGTGPVMLLLGLVTVTIVVGAGLFLWASGIRVNGGSTSSAEGIWISLLRALSAGTRAGRSG